MLREKGRLVTKDRFMDEVWRGVPVTDEALTQCIRALRRVLSDDAGRPRFIETVPKHGYRFIGSIETAGTPLARRPVDGPPPERPAARAAPRRSGAGSPVSWAGSSMDSASICRRCGPRWVRHRCSSSCSR
ncbi:transcriptional regulator [Sphingopyxis sp. PET50]|uniref:winged helix-turn-helix domain-containing protein n=1 Tax=Sphingopyxis sp. PET50 TaxID=2976533 RepID=UPI00391CF004